MFICSTRLWLTLQNVITINERFLCSCLITSRVMLVAAIAAAAGAVLPQQSGVSPCGRRITSAPDSQSAAFLAAAALASLPAACITASVQPAAPNAPAGERDVPWRAAAAHVHGEPLRTGPGVPALLPSITGGSVGARSHNPMAAQASPMSPTPFDDGGGQPSFPDCSSMGLRVETPAIPLCNVRDAVPQQPSVQAPPFPIQAICTVFSSPGSNESTPLVSGASQPGSAPRSSGPPLSQLGTPLSQLGTPLSRLGTPPSSNATSPHTAYSMHGTVAAAAATSASTVVGDAHVGHWGSSGRRVGSSRTATPPQAVTPSGTPGTIKATIGPDTAQLWWPRPPSTDATVAQATGTSGGGGGGSGGSGGGGASGLGSPPFHRARRSSAVVAGGGAPESRLSSPDKPLLPMAGEQQLPAGSCLCCACIQHGHHCPAMFQTMEHAAHLQLTHTMCFVSLDRSDCCHLRCI